MYTDITKECTLCPRECRVDRTSGKKGYCGMESEIRAARAALHMWEEPCISGTKGSGAVFFSGCTMRCVFCQNYEIANGNIGKIITIPRLAEIFLELQEKGAANLNLVTACHFLPEIIPAIIEAKKNGLSIPIVYNSSGFEKTETLMLLDGLIDVYLPDFKYMDAVLAQKYSKALDYPEIAKKAIREMVRQTGPCRFSSEGYIEKGTIVRHLILPGHTRDSKAVLEYLHKEYGNQIYISIMSQYTPLSHISALPELNRKITRREYNKVLDFALEIGVENGFFQEGEAAMESFIPLFDFEGL